MGILLGLVHQVENFLQKGRVRFDPLIFGCGHGGERHRCAELFAGEKLT